MNSLAFFKSANDRQIKKERFYRTSTHVDLRLCKLPASEIPPFSWSHENGVKVVIKNKRAIVLWVKIAKKDPEFNPVQNGTYPESLTHSYYTRKEG